MASGSSPSSSFDRRPGASPHRWWGLDRAWFRTEPTGFRTMGRITLCRVPRPTPFLTGFTSPAAPFHVSEAGKRCSEARFRASEPGSRGPETRSRASEAGSSGSEARFRASEPGRRGSEGRLDGLEGGMNGPVAGIRASEARMRHRMGGKRTPLGRASGPQRRRDARRSRRIAAHGRESTVPGAARR